MHNDIFWFTISVFKIYLRKAYSPREGRDRVKRFLRLLVHSPQWPHWQELSLSETKSEELLPDLPHWYRCPRNWANPHWFSQAASRKRDHKWSSQDVKWQPNGMLELENGGLACWADKTNANKTTILVPTRDIHYCFLISGLVPCSQLQSCFLPRKKTFTLSSNYDINSFGRNYLATVLNILQSLLIFI